MERMLSSVRLQSVIFNIESSGIPFTNPQSVTPLHPARFRVVTVSIVFRLSSPLSSKVQFSNVRLLSSRNS